MNRFTTTRKFWPLFAACWAVLICVSLAEAASWYWGSHPDKERLVIEFDRPVTNYSLGRTAKQTLTVKLPFTSGQLTQKTGTKSPEEMELLRPPSGEGFTLQVHTQTPAFGYIASVVSGKKLVVDIFSDPIGSRWRPSITTRRPKEKKRTDAGKITQEEAQPANTTKTEAKATKHLKQPQPVLPHSPVVEKPGTRDLSKALPAPVPEISLDQEPNPLDPAQTKLQQQDTTATEAPPSPAPVIATGVQRPFFAVPYSFRSRINHGGPEEWQEVPVSRAAPIKKKTDKQFNGVRTKVGPPPSTKMSSPQRPVVVQTTTSTPQPTASQRERQRFSMPPPAGPTPPAAPAQIAPPPVEEQAVTQIPAATGSGHIIRSRIAQPGESITVQGGQSVASTAPAQLSKQVAASESTVRYQASDQTQTSGPFPEKDSGIPATEPVEDSPAVTPPAQELEPVADNLPAQPEEPVVYVDENGNPIPPPPTPQELMFQAKAAFNNGEIAAAKEQFAMLKRRKDLTEEQREEVLYGLADTTYSLGKDDLVTNFDEITNTFTEAMNYNLKSNRVPSALLQLGLVNMKTGNIGEATAYFNILRKKYPNHDNIPMTYYYWGEHYFKKKDWQKAADNFQYVVQNYPDSRFVREAGVSLARSLYNLGFFEQAYQIVDFVEKRWPRFYVEYPPFLNIMGDVAYRKKEYDSARTRYWTYYNIDPNGEEADLILARLGDIYLLIDENPSAREVYEEAARKFPDRDGGLIALMRLAEEGIHDKPSISDMFSVFDRPYNLRPLQIYSQIIEDHPESDLVPLARLKKAMWYLWNKEFSKALRTATNFGKKHPGHALSERVKEVALRAFTIMVADNIQEGNYDRILQIWDQFPIVRGQEEKLAPESRIALGLSYSKKEQPSKALKTIDPFFQGLKVPEYSEMALNLALSIYLENERWDDILKLAQRVELWELNQDVTHKMQYAQALALENINQPEKALPLWQTLRKQEDVPLTQEANTFYFLARDAQRKEQYDEAYSAAEQALRSFREQAKRTPEEADIPKIKDMLSTLVDITETTGRAKESLNWAKQYAEHVSPQDADYPSLQYRLARLYRKNSDMQKWEKILTDLRAKAPNSLYGKMAASELKTHKLTEGASQFSPTGKL